MRARPSDRVATDHRCDERDGIGFPHSISAKRSKSVSTRAEATREVGLAWANRVPLGARPTHSRSMGPRPTQLSGPAKEQLASNSEPRLRYEG